jgi:hypothetical protein
MKPTLEKNNEAHYSVVIYQVSHQSPASLFAIRTSLVQAKARHKAIQTHKDRCHVWALPSSVLQELKSTSRCFLHIFFHTARSCVLPKWTSRSRLINNIRIATEVHLTILLYIDSMFTNTSNSAPLAVAAPDAITSAQSWSGPSSPYYP